jgi:hypothetical protein
MSALPVDERQARLGYGIDPGAVLGKYGGIFKKLQKQAAGQFDDASVDEQQEPVRAPIGYGVFALLLRKLVRLIASLH